MQCLSQNILQKNLKDQRVGFKGAQIEYNTHDYVFMSL